VDENWIDALLSHDDLVPNRTGHAVIPAGPTEWGGRYSSAEVIGRLRGELGLGWLYYGLVRALMPDTIVCVGSGRGFVPILLAKAQADRHAGRPVTFIDPSFDDDFWADAANVRQWFARFDVDKYVQHHLMTTERFAATSEFAALPEIDLLYIDGSHFYAGVRTDYDLLSPRLAASGTLMLHDTVSRSPNPRWSGPRQLLLELSESAPDWQVLDLPYGAGLTVMRRRPPESRAEYLDQLRAGWQHPGSLEF
jgi:hypothetical protein